MAVVSSNLEKTVKVTGKVEFEDYSSDKVEIQLFDRGNGAIYMKKAGTVLLEKEDIDLLRNVLNGDIE